MRNVFILILLGTAAIISAQVVSFQGYGGDLIRFSTGISAESERTPFENRQLDTKLWIGIENNSRTTVPGVIEIDFSGESVNDRYLGDFTVLKSLSMDAMFSYVQETELNRDIPENSRYQGRGSELGTMLVMIEDSDGVSQFIFLGIPSCNGSEIEYLFQNPQYLYEMKRFDQYEQRSWFLRKIWIMGVRPYFMPEEIEIYWFELIGD